jgi:uncharacterized protein YndB with AHSA1/START domain
VSRRPLTVTTLGTRELVLTRTFAAPQPLVFDALTVPELLVRWYGAHGWRLVGCEVDLRVGGSWRYVSRGPGGEEMTQYGVYREIDAPHRLVYSERFVDQSFAGRSLITTVLEDRGERTTLRTTVRLPSPEARDLVIRRPMERGVGEGFDRLDQVLAARHTRRDDELRGDGPSHGSEVAMDTRSTS